LRSNISRKEEARYHLLLEHRSRHRRGACAGDSNRGFERVYNLSWKQPEPYPEFIPSLCRLAARLGWLRLGLLNVEGQTIAAQLWFVVNGRALIYKIAYDQAHAALSAGAVLTADMIRRVIDGEGQEVDYLSGDDSYKRHWMSRRRERFGIIAFNPAPSGASLLGSKHFLGKRIKHLRSREARFRPRRPPLRTDPPPDQTTAVKGRLQSIATAGRVTRVFINIRGPKRIAVRSHR
jgi:hypothetical protein